ncbi:hypothetical protein SK128_010762 [Halocaridina rubra]|uniref:Uncharacterized protein n=1 Tax=Halocaridina rubra TaxID=373956 RepID=A0AAN9A6K4_HALRR
MEEERKEGCLPARMRHEANKGYQYLAQFCGILPSSPSGVFIRGEKELHDRRHQAYSRSVLDSPIGLPIPLVFLLDQIS